MTERRGVERLRAGSVEVVVDLDGPGLPRVLHWGTDLGDLSEADIEALRVVSVPPVTSYVMDEPVPVSVLPEHGLGWAGFPGVQGHRDDGSAWSPVFTVSSAARDLADDGIQRLLVEAEDIAAELALRIELELTPQGLLRLRAALTNTSPDTGYWLQALTPTLPVPPQANELLDLAGRHTRERAPQRQPFHVGTRLRESRRGHGGHDAPLLLVAGTVGFGFRSGEVWGVHVAWSGNQRVYAERQASGAAALLGGGELLLPGEVRLEPGQAYASPWLYGSYAADGLDGLSSRFHRWLRSRPHHPKRPRPSLVNTWEAVYFDTDLSRLLALADQAAADGIERFVLDDGWFQGRRGEHAGLGDWVVDTDIWPDGLHPLVDHVRALGMEFGLWFEPEAVSADSRLAREHPDWVLQTGGRQPPMSREQQVLDLGNPAAYAHVLGQMDAILAEYKIAYVKWDMNRDIVDGGHGPTGRPGVHGQTLAVYALLDELRRRRPGVEFESCAGGGGRVDLGILERTDRIWASDSNDALERQQIQRWTGLLVPPELVGAHVGAEHSHTTGRTHSLDFRAGTALFGHLGVELDPTTLTPQDNEVLAQWVALYRRLRALLHSGDVVRADHPDPSLLLHGVVAPDRSQALFALVGLATPLTQPIGLVRLPGLDPSTSYRLRLVPPADRPAASRVLPPWVSAAGAGGPGLILPGSVLTLHGLQTPFLLPESLVLLEVRERVPLAVPTG